MPTNTSQIVIQIAEGIEVETDKYCDNFGIGHHPLSVSFRALGVGASLPGPN